MESSPKIMQLRRLCLMLNDCRKKSSLTTSSKSPARRITAEGEGEAPIWNQPGDLAEVERYCNPLIVLVTSLFYLEYFRWYMMTTTSSTASARTRTTHRSAASARRKSLNTRKKLPGTTRRYSIYYFIGRRRQKKWYKHDNDKIFLKGARQRLRSTEKAWRQVQIKGEHLLQVKVKVQEEEESSRHVRLSPRGRE